MASNLQNFVKNLILSITWFFARIFQLLPECIKICTFLHEGARALFNNFVYCCVCSSLKYIDSVSIESPSDAPLFTTSNIFVASFKDFLQSLLQTDVTSPPRSTVRVPASFPVRFSGF